jgi:hypothetical protein
MTNEDLRDYALDLALTASCMLQHAFQLHVQEAAVDALKDANTIYALCSDSDEPNWAAREAVRWNAGGCL